MDQEKDITYIINDQATTFKIDGEKIMLFDYDDTSEDSIYQYAKKLEGMTFQQIMDAFNNSEQKYYRNTKNQSFKVAEDTFSYTVPDSKAKGQLGNVIERYYFGYMPNGIQDADFSKTGIELKQTCIDKKKNGDFTAGERLSITNISFSKPVEEDFYSSHVWDKIKKILLIHYLRDKTIDRWQYQIKYVNMFSPPAEDLNIIIQDYNKIINKIKKGKAHEISESDTLYLGACTKGKDAKSSMIPQYYGEHILARRRNFCFKRQYMDYVLHEYVLKNRVPYESIIKSNNLNMNVSFESQIIRLIEKHIGKTDKELCDLFNRPYNQNKAQWTDITYRMLGIKGNKAEEFLKANISVRSIRVELNGKINENMSFSPFKFKELVKEEWENSAIYNYFETTRFLFVVYQFDGQYYKLQGAKIWNMPYYDLNVIAKKEWIEIRNIIRDGVKFTHKFRLPVNNNLPKSKNSKILHIRPHAQKAAYLLKDGFMIGDIHKNANELPDGQWMTTQSFWVNNTYIEKQIEDLI